MNKDASLQPRKAVFFDLDDTLYDQLVPFRNAVAEHLPEHAESLPADGLFRAFRRHSDLLWEPYAGGELPLETMRVMRLVRAFADFGVTIDERISVSVQEAYEAGQGRIRFLPGVEACFSELARSGYRIGVITNGPEQHQWRKIRALGLDRIVPREMVFISGAVGLTKPDPRLFEHVNRLSGTDPEQCIFVGDSWENDMLGARNAGWRGVWFNPRGNRPGEDYAPRLIVSDFADLAAFIIKSEEQCL